MGNMMGTMLNSGGGPLGGLLGKTNSNGM